jgi:deoxyribodipyrimidine photo-lyase
MLAQAANSARPVIVWFRSDLRLGDNRALMEACATGRSVICQYVFEEAIARRPHGGAQLWWLHHSLARLAASLAAIGGALCLRRGETSAILDEVIEASGADSVFWNRRHDPEGIAIDSAIKASLKARGINAASFDGQLLHEPTSVRTGAGGPFKVYTPFWRAFSALPAPRQPYTAPEQISGFTGSLENDTLDDWGLLPTAPDWANSFDADWQPGEEGAQEKLRLFIDEGLANYADGRNLPGAASTSRLSPHLAMGEISPFQVWHATLGLEDRHAPRDVEVFRKEVVWREFAYHLLFHFPRLATQNFNVGFDAFPWASKPELIEAWKRGQTGYPIVDAGMRQLWQTGWMHNRVRMAAASFLIKHLMADWRVGEAWFWDTLVDACPANNPASWQWVAGSGADAAPYYRIFNPVLQGEKFDADGAYVRRFVPEIAGLPNNLLHRPWEAGPLELAAAGIELGKNYPKPIVDHSFARDRALSAYKSLRGGG